MFHILLGIILIFVGLAILAVSVFGAQWEMSAVERAADYRAGLIGLIPIGLGVLAIWWW